MQCVKIMGFNAFKLDKYKLGNKQNVANVLSKRNLRINSSQVLEINTRNSVQAFDANILLINFY